MATNNSDDFTILVIGASGTGKSTVANLIAHGPSLCDETTREQHFPIVAGVVSGTKTAKPVSRLTEWGSFRVIDTMGLFQPEDDPAEALEKLADVVEKASYGIDAILFCTDCRLRLDTYEALKVVQRLLGEKNCEQRLVLTYTRVDKLAKKNRDEQSQFIEEQRRASKKFNEVLKICGDRWVVTGIPNIDDDPETEAAYTKFRGEVLAKLLKYLKERINAGKFKPNFVVEGKIVESDTRHITEATKHEIEKLILSPPEGLSTTYETLKGIAAVNLPRPNSNETIGNNAGTGMKAGMLLGAGGAFGGVVVFCLKTAGTVVSKEAGAIVGKVVSKIPDTVSNQVVENTPEFACAAIRTVVPVAVDNFYEFMLSMLLEIHS